MQKNTDAMAVIEDVSGKDVMPVTKNINTEQVV